MVQLEEEIMLGLKIMALFNTTLLTVSEDEEEFNYDLRLYVAPKDTEDFDYQLTSHPLEFVPSAVHDFLEEFYYVQRHPSTAIKYAKVNKRYLAAEIYYSNYINKFEEINMKKEASKNKNLEPR